MKKILVIPLIACAFSVQAQERCINTNNQSGTTAGNYSAGNGKTGSAADKAGFINSIQNISIGNGAQANGTINVAIGQQAKAEGYSAIAVGSLAEATGDESIVIGDNALANRCYSQATGTQAKATGYASQASGALSSASGYQAIASGYFSNASGNGSIANGSGSNATNTNTVAIGSNSQATHANSVALGANSRTTRPNEVNVGNRTIGGVQNGTLMNDAVNLGQMRAGDEWTLNEANRYTDRAIAGIDGRINRVGALNTAMTMMASSAATIPGKNKLAWGTGYYNGKVALAIGYQRLMYTKHSKMPYAITAGASFTSGARTLGVGMGFGF